MCKLYNCKKKLTNQFNFGEPFYVELRCKGLSAIKGLQYVVGINSSLDQRITTILSKGGDNAFNIEVNEQKTGLLKIDLCLNPNDYNLTISIRNEFSGFDLIQNICDFTINPIKDERIINDGFVPYGLVHQANSEWVIDNSKSD